MLTITDALLIAIGSGAVSGLIAWGGLRVELRWLRASIRAAHRRLDVIGAPSGWYDILTPRKED